MSANSLYFGDNLEILRNEIKSESVDLIYLDPPFNSNANYNILFRSPNGHEPHAQITAFEDTWHWGEQAEREFAELVQQSNTDVSEMMQALRRFLGENDMMAYLTMMANRLLELHRVLKQTGSIYLHCDPTASHYLKIVLDGVFGKEFFQNEVIWRRTTNSGSSKSIAKRFPSNSDVILFYTKSHEYKFAHVRTGYSEKYRSRFTKRDARGFYYLDNLKTYSEDRLAELKAEDRIGYTSNGKPRIKNYLDEGKGIITDNIWTDIQSLNSQARERLGYPTQKPLPLLERIISVSSNEGDIVLDPFCGCGTAIHASEKLKRKWIGIDITHLAINLVEDRLRAAFPGITFDVHGVPKDLDSARDLAQRDKYEFQYWACSLVKARPYRGKKKGADSGIDGVIPFKDDKTTHKKIIVSVKAGEHVSVPMIRDLGHVINREKASLGFFVTLTKPTAPMRLEAVKAGYYLSPVGPKSKIQILTIEGLLAGTEKPDYFDLTQGGLMSRKPEREVDAIQLGFDSAAYLSAVQKTEEPRRKDARVARAAKSRKLTKKTA